MIDVVEFHENRLSANWPIIFLLKVGINFKIAFPFSSFLLMIVHIWQNDVVVVGMQLKLFSVNILLGLWHVDDQ